jgi:hypothetical protein
VTSAGKENRLHIYPPNGTTAEQGHDFCRPDGPAPKWGDEVLTFLHEAGM